MFFCSSVPTKIFILQIIKQRIWRHTYQEGLVWNSDPGALMTLREFSDTLSHFPFHFGEYNRQMSQTGCEKFTAVIYTTLTSASSSATSKNAASGVHLSAPIFKLARNVAASNFAQQVNNNFWTFRVVENSKTQLDKFLEIKLCKISQLLRF